MANVVHSTLVGVDLHFSKVQVISGSPAFIPTYIGQTVYDQVNKILYIATGIVSINNWNGASYTSFNPQSGTSYTIASSDNLGTVALLSSSARAVTLLTSPINGFNVTIKDESGNAYNAPITITTGGADTFVTGGTSFIISSEYEAVTFQYDAANAVWTAI